MDNDDLELPEYLKNRIDKEFRKEVAATSFLPLYELSLFRWHIEETEALYEKMRKTELAYIGQQSNLNVEVINDSGMIAIDYFYKRIRYSDVIYLVSLLESALEAACSRLKAVLPEDSVLFEVRNLAGQKWERTRLYLEAYGRFARPKRLWKPIIRLINLRNAIVHDNGSTLGLNRQRRRAIEKCDGVRVSDGQISVTAEYVQCAVNDLEALLSYYQDNVATAIERIE
ncbi:hypothetical protein [Lentisalinibacter orientalis]|uniref:hypothetical protein n=1 Tax=Lentisalinibacter orientalis TaxID=2992241 RepID=UPI003870BF84